VIPSRSTSASKSSLGYEQDDARLCRLAGSPVAGLMSLARNDRGQVAQRVVEMVWSERRELNALAGTHRSVAVRTGSQPVIERGKCGIRGAPVRPSAVASWVLPAGVVLIGVSALILVL
jgi:hypothetical protein